MQTTAYKMIVFAAARAGMDDQLNEWYDKVHIPEIMQHPGFIGAQRFRLSDVQMTETITAERRYLTIYDIASEKFEKVRSLVLAGGDTVALPQALESATCQFFEPIGDHVSSANEYRE